MEIMLLFFFFNDTATTEIYTLSLHDALPICGLTAVMRDIELPLVPVLRQMEILGIRLNVERLREITARVHGEIGEHTSELQSRQYLVCRLLLEKKKNEN